MCVRVLCLCVYMSNFAVSGWKCTARHFDDSVCLCVRVRVQASIRAVHTTSSVCM